jgi:hypothetical protein
MKAARRHREMAYLPRQNSKAVALSLGGISHTYCHGISAVCVNITELTGAVSTNSISLQDGCSSWSYKSAEKDMGLMPCQWAREQDESRQNSSCGPTLSMTAGRMIFGRSPRRSTAFVIVTGSQHQPQGRMLWQVLAGCEPCQLGY